MGVWSGGIIVWDHESSRVCLLFKFEVLVVSNVSPVLSNLFLFFVLLPGFLKVFGEFYNWRDFGKGPRELLWYPRVGTG